MNLLCYLIVIGGPLITHKTVSQSICTINWSDVLGGAGIQVDSAAYAVLGVMSSSVLTGFAAHNTMGKVVNQEVDIELLRAQFESLWLSMPPSIIKCGALFSVPVMEEVLRWIKHFSGVVIYDPVILSPAGEVLLDPSAIDYLKANFLPHVSILTANLSQLSHLYGHVLDSDELVEEAVNYVIGFGVGAVLLKVGPQGNYYRCYWRCSQGAFWLKSPLHDNSCTYGAGTMLSAALTSFLSKGMGLLESFAMSQFFVSGCIRRGKTVGNIGFAICQPFCYSSKDKIMFAEDGELDFRHEFYAHAKSMGRYKKRFHSGLRPYEVLVWACDDVKKQERLNVVMRSCRQNNFRFCLEGTLEQAIRFEVDMVLVSLSQWKNELRVDLMRLKIHVGVKVSSQMELLRASLLKPSFLVVEHSAFHLSQGVSMITIEGLSWWKSIVSCPILVEDRLGYCHILDEVPKDCIKNSPVSVYEQMIAAQLH